MILLMALVFLQLRSASGGVVCKDHRGQGGGFRMLQPADMDLIMHGAGQDAASFRNYWTYMGNATKPMLCVSASRHLCACQCGGI